MMIRPQKKQKAKTEEMHNQMEPGDNIMTTSGFYGTILDIVDDTTIIVKAHGGEISAENLQDGGAVVRFTLDMEETEND